MFNFTGRFILNGFQTRAWTFQEISVAKEIEIMGLFGTLEEFCELTEAVKEKSILVFLFLFAIFASTRVNKEDNISKYGSSLHAAIIKRSALYAHDIFYAILPVYDSSVAGKNHLEAWNSIRVKYAISLLQYKDYMFRQIAWIDTYWYGIKNVQILQAFAKPIKMKACHKDDKLYVNWTIDDIKLHVTVDLLGLKGDVKQEENTWYFYSSIASNIACMPVINDGHLEETNEWKEYTFVFKMKDSFSVRLISANDLYAADLGNTSDPYVKISFDDYFFSNTTEVIF